MANDNIKEIKDDYLEEDYVDGELPDSLDYNEYEEDLFAISLHGETIIFNRGDGSWYMKSYGTDEIAKKVYDLEKSRLK